MGERDPDDEQTKPELAQDLRATLGAHRDLGVDYDRELADAFVERVDGLIARRVADELARQQPWPPQQWSGQWQAPHPWPGQWLGPGQVPHYLPVAYTPPPPRRAEGYPVPLAVWSMLFGWLASLSVGNVFAIAVVWCGIVAVNAVVALGTRRRPPD